MSSLSFEGRIAAWAVAALTLSVALSAWLGRTLDSWWLGALIGLVPALVLLIVVLHRGLRPINRLLSALSDGVNSLKDSDFGISVAVERDDELGQLVRAYNQLGDVLRGERQTLYQRELLLDTVIQSTPSALVLVNDNDRVVYSNTAARRLLTAGRGLNGMLFAEVLVGVPGAFGEAVRGEHNGLFTVEGDEPETWHLSVNRFALNTQPHRLYLFKQLTHEISRQEVSTWKKVIRVISHELNNSLAPISSLAHSGKLVSETPDPERLDSIFGTIEERANHLKQFIEGYARFARLPAPQPVAVDWATFVERLRQVHHFQLHGTLPERPGQFDPAQLEQVMINLLKNAHEADSTPEQIELQVRADGQTVRIQLDDRGCGMSEAVMRSALLPFYSTKQTGTGLGLPLCREIVEAHGGRLRLANRAGGGLSVNVVLPDS